MPSRWRSQPDGRELSNSLQPLDCVAFAGLLFDSAEYWPPVCPGTSLWRPHGRSKNETSHPWVFGTGKSSPVVKIQILRQAFGGVVARRRDPLGGGHSRALFDVTPAKRTEPNRAPPGPQYIVSPPVPRKTSALRTAARK